LLDVQRRGYPLADDYWDGNWLVVDMSIEMWSWRGRYEALLRADEFERFLEGLRPLQADLVGTATFASMEAWLFLHLTGDGLGHIDVEGDASALHENGTNLSFRTTLDQSFLPGLIRELEAVMSAFPVVGERPSPSH
jgi:hypothetical protein